MTSDQTTFLSRLHADAAFRKRFVKDPESVLTEAGLDAAALDLPDKIDEAAFKAKLDAVFDGPEWAKDFARSDPAKLTTKELWERFGVIGKLPGGPLAGRRDDAMIALAVVIYGTSLATSGGSHVSTSGKGLPIASVEQMRLLRDLSRLPKSDLTFSVTGPDGTGIDGINAELLTAFLRRVT